MIDCEIEIATHISQLDYLRCAIEAICVASGSIESDTETVYAVAGEERVKICTSRLVVEYLAPSYRQIGRWWSHNGSVILEIGSNYRGLMALNVRNTIKGTINSAHFVVHSNGIQKQPVLHCRTLSIINDH